VLRVISVVVCAIVVLAFIVFAANQTKTASNTQQEDIASLSPGANAELNKPKHESGIHEALDEASNKLTSPFAGAASGSSSEWTKHGVRLLLALLVYGFGLGFIARTLRVRM
jgi:hypothetical protein